MMGLTKTTLDWLLENSSAYAMHRGAIITADHEESERLADVISRINSDIQIAISSGNSIVSFKNGSRIEILELNRMTSGRVRGMGFHNILFTEKARLYNSSRQDNGFDMYELSEIAFKKEYIAKYTKAIQEDIADIEDDSPELDKFLAEFKVRQ